jgi:hypothetical protein
LIEFWKRSKLPGLSIDSAKLNMIVAGALSLIAALGITITISGNAETGWHGSFSIPAVGVLIDGLIHFCTQVGLNQLLYHNGVKPLMNGISPPKA